MAKTLEQVCSSLRLGDPVEEFTYSVLWRVIIWPSVGFLLLLGAVAIVICSWTVVPRIAYWEMTAVKGTILGVVLVLIGLVPIYGLATYRPLRFVAGTTGFAFFENNTRAFHRNWDEIDKVCEIRRDSLNGLELLQLYFGGRMREVRLEFNDGKKLTIPGLVARFSAMLRRIQNSTLSHMLPPALEAIANGDVVRFGHPSASREGMAIVRRGKIFPWERIKKLRVRKDMVDVVEPGKWLVTYQIQLDMVDNLHVLQAVVAEYGGYQSSRDAT